MRSSSPGTHAAVSAAGVMFDPSRPRPAMKKEKTMTTLFTIVTTTNEHSRRKNILRLGAAASSAALVLGLLGSGIVHGQVSPLQIIPQAQGSSHERTPNMHVNGPNDVLQALLAFQPGAETGWHIHPGPV